MLQGLLGIVFDTQVGVVLSVVGMLHSHTAGYRFRYPRLRSRTFFAPSHCWGLFSIPNRLLASFSLFPPSSYCQVSFSIPVVTWEYLCSPNLCCSPILLGIVFDTRECLGNIAVVCQVSFSIPEVARGVSLWCVGYRFRYPSGRGAFSCWYVAFPHNAGYRFRYPRLRSMTFFAPSHCWGLFSIPNRLLASFSLFPPSSYCRVSFSIPVSVRSSHPNDARYRFRYPWVLGEHRRCVPGIVFDTCGCELSVFLWVDGYRLMPSIAIVSELNL